jgi:hypothetical protein
MTYILLQTLVLISYFHIAPSQKVVQPKNIEKLKLSMQIGGLVNRKVSTVNAHLKFSQYKT